MTTSARFSLVYLAVGLMIGTLITFSIVYGMKKNPPKPKDVVIPLSQNLAPETLAKIFSTKPDGQLPTAQAPVGYDCFQWLSTVKATDGTSPVWVTTLCIKAAA